MKTHLKQDISSGYAALRNGAAIVDRPDARLLIRGADRREYLQGILTNDIAALTPGTGCYAAMLTAQGRMITDMRVLELGDAILLDVPLAIGTAVREHLERFVFSEDVQVEDVTSVRVEMGVYGPRAADVIAAAGVDGGLPGALYGSARARIAGHDALIVTADTIGISGFDIVVDVSAERDVRAALAAAGAVPADAGDTEAVRVESGRPRFGLDMDTDTIPLEAGLEDRAISRSKGCYVGQEVIVRVQDRGHGRVARRLVSLAFDASAAVPHRHATIHAGDREIGRVTSAAWSPSLARPVALGYVHRDFVEPGTRVIVGGLDALVSSLPPYPDSAVAIREDRDSQ
jgi:tRNA-modifying protein YgfZ